MTERILLAWFLLFYLSHVQCARTAMEKQECPKEGHEDGSPKDGHEDVRQISETGSARPGVNGRPLLHSPLPSLVMLRQGSRDMSGQNSLIPPNRDLALASGLMLQVILLILLLLTCQRGGRDTPSIHERDDDSDGSVLALGDALDGFVWWDKSKASSLITSTNQWPGINLIRAPWSCASLDDIFDECGLAELWAVAKSEKLAQDITGELSQGKSSFFRKSAYATEQMGLKCIVYVMQVALHCVPDNLVLQEFTRPGYRNNFLTDELRLPKTKLRNCERIDECFMRCITLKLGLSQDIAEKLVNTAVLLRAGEETTTGSAAAEIRHMTTLVRKLTILVRLENVGDKLRKDLGIDGGRLHVDDRGMEFQWEKVGEDYGLRKLLKRAPDARKVKPIWKAPGPAVMPWSSSDVNKELTSRGIAPDSFGKDLSRLVEELRTGKVQLGIEEASGNLVCVEHRVYLRLSKKNGDVLVHQSDAFTGSRLPYVVVLANETPWIAALRAARTQLGSVFVRVELQLHAQDVQTTVVSVPPKMFSNVEPIAYVVRETVVDALAS